MALENNWKYKTLENLEGLDWGDGEDAPTGLVRRCIKLTKKPLIDFTVEDIATMIGQQIGLNYLLPLALEFLNVDLFAEGLFPGHLLQSVLNIDSSFWEVNDNFWIDVNELIKDRKSELEDENISYERFESRGKLPRTYFL